MKARIDRFGRLVIPHLLREKVALSPGSEVDIAEEDGHLTITPFEETPLVTRESTGILVLHAELTIDVDPLEFVRKQRIQQAHGA